MPTTGPGRASDGSGRPPRTRRTCNHCGQSFSKTEHLDRHVRSHTREKPFACTVCSKAYGRQDSLQRHVRSHRHGQNSSVSSSRGSVVADSTRQIGTSPSAATALVGAQILVPDNVLATGLRLDDLGREGMANFAHNSLEAGIAPDETNPSPSDIDPLSMDALPFDTSWLLGDDFDVHALDLSIANTITDWGRPTALFPDVYETLVPAVGLGSGAAGSNTTVAVHTAAAVQQNWYSNVTPDATASSATRRPSQQETVDDEYRASLTRRLQARMSDDVLPSADFLVGFDMIPGASYCTDLANGRIYVSSCISRSSIRSFPLYTRPHSNLPLKTLSSYFRSALWEPCSLDLQALLPKAGKYSRD